MNELTVYRFKGEPKHLLSKSKMRFDDKGILEVMDDGTRSRKIQLENMKKKFKFTKSVYILTKKTSRAKPLKENTDE